MHPNTSKPNCRGGSLWELPYLIHLTSSSPLNNLLATNDLLATMGIISPEYINHRRFKSLNGFYFVVATFLAVATFLSNVSVSQTSLFVF
jgi:hypothetical protein